MSLIVPQDYEMEARLRERVIRDAEKMLEDSIAEAMREFLARCRAAVVGDALVASLVSPGTNRMLDIGQMNGWWEAGLDDAVRPVADIYRYGRASASDGAVTQRSLDSMGQYVAQVKDRLSTTATPTIPDQAMATIRKGLADELSRGSPVTEISRRLASDLNWTGPDVGFWQDRRTSITDELERMLNGYGPPGSPARESARLSDPAVRELQAQRSEAVRSLDADRSQWQTRAERIARTETTGAYNAGAQSAFFDEGATVKMWLPTADERTRESHLDAGGRCVPVDEPFEVGETYLMMPGDPSGPAEEVINCRCTMIAGRNCEELGGFAEPALNELDRERDDRGLEPGPGESTFDGIQTGDVDSAGLDPARLPDPNDPDGLTANERANVRTIETFDVGYQDLDGQIAALPENVMFSMDKATVHGHTLGPCRAMVQDGRLLIVEDPIHRFRVTATAQEFLERVALEAGRAHPGGVDSPLKSIVYAAGNNVGLEKHYGFQIAGLASRNSISIYNVGLEGSSLRAAVNAQTLRHEIGHSLAHAANQKVVREAVALPAARRAAQVEIDAARPAWMRQQIEARPLLTPVFDNVETTAKTILDYLPPDQRDAARAEVAAFVKARNAATRRAEDQFRLMVKHSGDSLATWEDRITFGFVTQPDAAAKISSPTPGTVFNTAARKDADRLQNLRHEERLRYRTAQWDERRVSDNGYESFSGRASRPGVTNYAASVERGVEDWAETWRLFTSDRIDGGIGTATDGTRIRFAEMFPERARAIQEWAAAMSYDLSTIAP